ncbi:MAG: HEAT repeat domain-containing protein [Pirellulales bacterium]
MLWHPLAAVAEDANEDLIKLVVGLLTEDDRAMRALGFEQVRSAAPGGTATERFAAELPNLPAEAQVGLLSALATRGDGAARPAVVALLEGTEDDAVRVAAIEALGPLGRADDAKPLTRLLGDGSAAEQKAATTSLIQLTDDGAVAAILAELKAAPPTTQVKLIDVLLARRSKDAVPELLTAAVAEDARVRAAAMNALGQLADGEHVAGMVQGVLKAEPGREQADAEKCLMFVCARIEDPAQQAAPLLAAMEELSETDRRTMLSALGRVGGPGALKMVEEAISSDDSQLHSLGIKAISNWPDASIAPRLLELAKTDEHEGHRITALRALMRVAPLPDDRTDAERLELLKTAMSISERDAEKILALDRARAIRTPESLRFVLPYVDQSPYAEQACLSIVELAHHRGLREPNKEEFHKALDKVIETSQDATVIDRAKRYKKDETWVRPG